MKGGEITRGTQTAIRGKRVDETSTRRPARERSRKNSGESYQTKKTKEVGSIKREYDQEISN